MFTETFFFLIISGRVVLIQATAKEMTKVLRLLDAINLKYDIVVNKFDLVKIENREKFKQKIRDEVKDLQLKGVQHIWFVSVTNPSQFEDWMQMVDYLTNK